MASVATAPPPLPSRVYVSQPKIDHSEQVYVCGGCSAHNMIRTQPTMVQPVGQPVMAQPVTAQPVTAQPSGTANPPAGAEDGGNWVTEKYFGPVSCMWSVFLGFCFLPLCFIPCCCNMDKTKLYLVKGKTYTEKGKVVTTNCTDCECLLCCWV